MVRITRRSYILRDIRAPGSLDLYNELKYQIELKFFRKRFLFKEYAKFNSHSRRKSFFFSVRIQLPLSLEKIYNFRYENDKS